MEPTIKTGSAVAINGTGDYVKDDIITFRRMGQDLITHRIVSVSGEGENEKYKTKGDNNENPDIILVEKEYVEGEVLFPIPFFGYLIMWAKQPIGIIILIIIPAGWIITEEAFKIRKELKKKKYLDRRRM